MSNYACSECNISATYYCHLENKKLCEYHLNCHLDHVDNLIFIEAYESIYPVSNEPKKDLQTVIQAKQPSQVPMRSPENKPAFPVLQPEANKIAINSPNTNLPISQQKALNNIQADRKIPNDPVPEKKNIPSYENYPNYPGYSNPPNKPNLSAQQGYYPKPSQQNPPISYQNKPEINPVFAVYTPGKPEPVLLNSKPKIGPSPGIIPATDQKKPSPIQEQINALTNQLKEIKQELNEQKTKKAELLKILNAEKEKNSKLEQDIKLNPRLPEDNPNMPVQLINRVEYVQDQPELDVDLYKVPDFCHRCMGTSVWYCLEDQVALCNNHTYEHQGHRNSIVALPNKQHLPVNKLEKEARRVKHQIQDVIRGIFNT